MTKNGNTTILTESFTYKAPSSTTTSAQIATYTTTAPNGYSVTYTYTYDDNGNINGINDGTGWIGYEYDSANQLVLENNYAAGYVKTWTYDNAGNIDTREEYVYKLADEVVLAGTYEYNYLGGGLSDILVGIDSPFNFDCIGNTLSDSTRTYTWEHGRQLASVSDGIDTWSYTYNADGLRTKKSNGTDTYTYVYNGSQLTQLTKGTDSLYFTYDAAGTPLSLNYNGTVYYYATNIQGDVVAILNGQGNAVVTYAYDAWGNPLSRTGSMANTLGVLNPLRYRGYVYDQETKLYYLQSRYYNPELGRFISADAFVATGQGFLGNNMFAYCRNNPVRYADSSGHVPDDVLLKNAQLYASGANILMCGYQNNSHNAAKAIYSTHTRKNVVIYDNGVTPSDVVVNNTKNVIVYDKRDSNLDENGNHNPDIQILNSYLITDRVDQVGVFAILILYNYSNPSEYEWRRTQTSFLIEWDMHNFFAFADQSAKDVDFDNKEEGAGYLYFCGKAAYKFGKKIIKPFLP